MGYLGSKLWPTKAHHPKISVTYKPSIELTGKGDQLCYDAYGGRWFRSSCEAVGEAVEFFMDEYERGNRLNYNDLYALLGISQTAFGYQYGYSPDESYRVDMNFTLAIIKKEDLHYYTQDFGTIWGEMDEDILLIEPDPKALPFESYWEV